MDHKSSSNIKIHIQPEFLPVVSESELTQVVVDTLHQERNVSESHVSVVITDDEEINRLNKQFRGIDRTTDVLAFGFQTQGLFYGSGPSSSSWNENEPFILPPEASQLLDLGEIFISFHQAERQANSSNISTQKELHHLLSHGVLHLLGYDHRNPNEEHEMNLKIDKALSNGFGNA